MQCGNMSLERGTRAIRNNRYLMLSTKANDPADFLRAVWRDNGVGRNAGVKGFVLTKTLQHGCSLGKALTKLCLKASYHLSHRGRRGPDFCLIGHDRFSKRMLRLDYIYLPGIGFMD